MARKTNCVKNGIAYYRVTRTVGRKADGSPDKKEFYGTCKADADQQADEYMNNLKNGINVDEKNVTINILLPKWLFSVKKNELKPSSFEAYESTYRNYIRDFRIANIAIQNIRSIKIQEYYNKMNKKEISVSNIKKVHKLLRQFFSYAEREGYVMKNPCSNVVLPKQKKANAGDILASKQVKFSYFNEKEIEELKKAFSDNKYSNIVLFALGTGMRQGEILGLQWNDIDFDKKEIHVIHNLNTAVDILENGSRTYKTILQEPKTNNSIRIIPISQTILEILQSLPRISEFVFCKEDGRYLDAKVIQKNWKKTLQRNNIEYRKFHDLRHTFATMLLTHGADVITVKELLGHSSVKITEMYLDALPKTKQDIIQKIDFLLQTESGNSREIIK